MKTNRTQRWSAKETTCLLAGVALGCTGMYLLDPDNGRARRVLCRDKAMGLARDCSWVVSRYARDLKNRTRGLRARIMRIVSEDETVDDTVLQARIRSEFGRKVSHPKSVKVMVSAGVVTLTGLILSDEIEALIACVRSVPGVRRVINNLGMRTEAGNIPGLQGEGSSRLHH
jgi:hypothetical protein